MSCPQLHGASPRISARRGQVVDLNVDFLNNGVLTDPFAIYKVEIYRAQVLPHNLVAVIPVLSPAESLYPAPLCQDHEPAPVDPCTTGTEDSDVPIVGKYHLPYLIPVDAVVPDIYFDVWYYFASDPIINGTSPTEDELNDHLDLLLKCCHRFWVYPEEWYCNDKLQTIRFGFEPIDQKFYSPELRPLEIGLMPLPLYDYNVNLVVPMIPFLKPTITIKTQREELLVECEACRIGIRQGSYRTNPWVIQYDLDTNKFLKGTYQYYITLHLPDGSTRVSRRFILTIA